MCIRLDVKTGIVERFKNSRHFLSGIFLTKVVVEKFILIVASEVMLGGF